MSNEEIINRLRGMIRYDMFKVDREALEAAISRLSAPARTEWVFQWAWSDFDTHWTDIRRFDIENEAQNRLRIARERLEKDCIYRVIERTTFETVKEW